MALERNANGTMRTAVVLVQCPDQKGLVSKISTFWYGRGFNIVDCQQHVDVGEGRFFMRLKLDLEERVWPLPEEIEFQRLADDLGLAWSSHASLEPARVAILVSRAPHCLYDLLVRQREGELPCEIPLIISNHSILSSVAAQFGIPFHHLPVAAETKPEQERRVQALLQEKRIDLIVLARYMQILSPDFASEHARQIINIHHGFLPAFQGSNAYQRAYERGVKMIGATAHYVTADLDEGPIIEQDVERVTHEHSPTELSRMGHDIERVVLARAVKAHLEHRVIVSGRRTIVFSAGA
jgi:formyltetrahydrofolate deformylase